MDFLELMIARLNQDDERWERALARSTQYEHGVAVGRTASAQYEHGVATGRLNARTQCLIDAGAEYYFDD
jgi:hypothetical protein